MFKVIAKREVAQHLKIGAVAGGLADPLDIRRTDALLAGGHPACLAGSPVPRKNFFMGAIPELMSSRLLSSMGHQRIAGQAGMTLALKKREELFPKLV